MSSSVQPHGPRSRADLLFLGLLIALIGPASVQAQETEVIPEVLPDSRNQEEVVNYPAAFFERYQPNTALDMVEQIPGFQIDDGGSERGFGASTGNILVDNRRISAKQDLPSDILNRIPAGNVERIELIRGQVPGIDLLGQSVVVNVLLRGDVPAAGRWETRILKNFLDLSAKLSDQSINVSRSARWGDIDYNAGVNLTRRGTGDDIEADILDSDDNLIEKRLEEQAETAYMASGTLNLSTEIGRTLLNMNTQLAWQDFDTMVVSDRTPTPVNTADVPRVETFVRDTGFKEIEIGGDAERSLTDDLIGKAIVLFFRNDSDTFSSQRVVEDAAGQTLLRVAESTTETTEAITRLEFDWAGWQDHAVQLNIEGAFNVIEGSLAQTVDTGSGPVEVDVPRANTRVEELRADILLKDTWSLGNWQVNYGLGAELSEISQGGATGTTRSFFFIKPEGLITWSPRQGEQTRLRLVREVAQLNLNDFVTTTQFQDENLLLGGRDLEPDSTWIAEISHERRFGDVGVVSLTGFHHWISDVQDLVPLAQSDELDAPGNIGSGRRWGLELESTLPLERLGLTGARLDLKARWSDSTVTDPVTSVDRVLTGRSEHQGAPNFTFSTRDNNFKYIYNIAFRQDFQQARWAWGWNFADRGERTWFKINELNLYDEEGMELNAFVETTRWFGVKIQLEGSNLMEFVETRDRTVFTGRRGLTPVARRELTDTVEGWRLTLTVSGSF